MEITVLRGKRFYEGTAGSTKVISDISIDAAEEVARAAFEVGASIVEAQLEAVLDATTAALLPLYNDTWRDDDAPVLDAASFRAALEERSISVTELDNPTYLVTVYFDCGDLFAGHWIEVLLERDGRILGKPGLIG